jgi:regulatory protein
MVCHCQGGSSFHISARQLSAWHLSEGQELDERQYQEIKRLKRRDDCQEKALSLLSMREHTTKELKEKLQARGFFGEDIDPVISQLKEEGSLDEARYAESRSVPVNGGIQKESRCWSSVWWPREISRDEAARAVDAAFAEQGEAFLSQAVRNGPSHHQRSTEAVWQNCYARAFPGARSNRRWS